MLLSAMKMTQYPPGTQPSIQHQSANAESRPGVLDGSGVQGEVPVNLLLSPDPSRPKNHWSLATVAGGSRTNPNHYGAPTTLSIQAPIASHHNLVVQQNNHVLSSTAVSGIVNNTTQSFASNGSIPHPPSFLPTPPPEPYSSLPQCATPEFDLREFERSHVYPFGVRTPGVDYSPEDGYFGK